MSEPAWTYAQVLDKNGKKINPIVFGYVIKRNGIQIGTLKRVGRPKSCGGSAWCGTVIDVRIMSTVCFYDKDMRKVLAWFKAEYDEVIRSHSRRMAA